MKLQIAWNSLYLLANRAEKKTDFILKISTWVRLTVYN